MVGQALGPCGDSMRGHRDMGQQGWKNNRHPQIGGCAPHPLLQTSLSEGWARQGIFCMSFLVLSQFSHFPFLEHAQTKAMLTTGCGLALALPAGDGSRAVASLTSPRATGGVFLAAHPKWEISSCFYLCVFPTKCSWRSGEPTEQTPPHLNKQQNHCKILSCALQLHIFTHPTEQKRGALLN